MPPLRCILLGTEIVPAESEAAWIRWMQPLANRQIAKTSLGGGCFVSTVFLGENVGTDDEPEWFETMIAGTPAMRAGLAEYLRNSSTYAAAKRVHEAMVERATNQLNRKKTPSV